MLFEFVAVLVSVLAPPDGLIDYAKIDIPEPYRGRWALDRAFCAEPGDAVVDISPRRIDRYEEHALLRLANLDHADDPPNFYGRFEYVELRRFREGTVRLELHGGNLFMTVGDDPDAEASSIPWLRCPPM